MPDDSDILPGSPIPPHLAALIPDLVESEITPPKAREAIRDIRKEADEAAQRIIDAQKSVPTAKVALNGIFRHPPEFTEEAWDVIIAGLRANLPMYAIAMRVHCERHFLTRKIAEMKEVAQLAIDAKETRLDIAEDQLAKAIKAGSLAAIMYFLDHHGQSRGYGEQQEKSNAAEEVHISFGEISDRDLAEGKRLIAEAQKKTTPTLAGELAALEENGGVPIPASASPQDLAAAEDMLKAINASSAPRPVDVTPQTETSVPPYAQEPQPDPKQAQYDFLENAFSEGGDSPFGSF